MVHFITDNLYTWTVAHAERNSGSVYEHPVYLNSCTWVEVCTSTLCTWTVAHEWKCLWAPCVLEQLHMLRGTVEVFTSTLCKVVYLESILALLITCALVVTTLWWVLDRWTVSTSNTVHFKLAVITFNALTTLQPSYLAELLSVHVPRRDLRSGNYQWLLIPRNKLKFTDSATQHRPFGMDFLLLLLPPVQRHISNGRSKLNCTVVRLTETDSWPPALKILPSEWLLVRYQPYNNNNINNNGTRWQWPWHVTWWLCCICIMSRYCYTSKHNSVICSSQMFSWQQTDRATVYSKPAVVLV